VKSLSYTAKAVFPADPLPKILVGKMYIPTLPPELDVIVNWNVD
jgi:hypothetical protein